MCGTNFGSGANFNSHAHVERDCDVKHCHCVVANFNSHAHVERDTSSYPSVMIRKISTHTLTWSVTMTVKK